MTNQAQLLRDACRGDMQAQSELFASRIDPLIRLAFLITRDHAAAEDAVQEALISSTRHIGSLRESDRFDAWLRRIVVNQAKTFRRRNARLIPTEDMSERLENSTGRRAEPGPEETVVRREDEARLLTTIHTLGDKLRIPVLMRYYMDMKERDIAQAMRLPVSTIKSRLHAARRKLREALEKEEKARERLQ
ncbi:MAG: RNA polymerase sigma factor [Clostridia bacterium]|nr:RNA polymerase sigma factor [Clostridia bacterium]